MKSTKTLTLLLILFFLIACKPSPEGVISYNFKQGYGNLVISTLENSPPDIIYPNSDFRITVKLENQGAYKLTEGKIKLLGFDKKYISLVDAEVTGIAEKEIISLEEEDFLEGRSAFNPKGGLTFIEFEARANELFPGAESYTAHYFIKADYKYKTELAQTICLNPKIYDVHDAGCKVKPKTSLNGQGSPLAITYLEEIIYPGPLPEVEFRLALKNKGKGKIKQVTLNQAKLADKSLYCEFKNAPIKRIFEFKEKQEAVLICKTTLEEQKSYETVLFLELSFDYSIKEKKKITTRKFQ